VKTIKVRMSFGEPDDFSDGLPDGDPTYARIRFETELDLDELVRAKQIGPEDGFPEGIEGWTLPLLNDLVNKAHWMAALRRLQRQEEEAEKRYERVKKSIREILNPRHKTSLNTDEGIPVRRYIDTEAKRQEHLGRERQISNDTTDDVLHTCLLSIPQTYRELLWYRYAEGHTIVECTEKFGFDKSKISRDCRAYLAELRHMLEDRGIEPHQTPDQTVYPCEHQPKPEGRDRRTGHRCEGIAPANLAHANLTMHDAVLVWKFMSYPWSAGLRRLVRGKRPKNPKFQFPLPYAQRKAWVKKACCSFCRRSIPATNNAEVIGVGFWLWQEYIRPRIRTKDGKVDVSKAILLVPTRTWEFVVVPSNLILVNSRLDKQPADFPKINFMGEEMPRYEPGPWWHPDDEPKVKIGSIETDLRFTRWKAAKTLGLTVMVPRRMETAAD
jgi:DNA-directed RNA polymerase specialized sigma24 family protein